VSGLPRAPRLKRKIGAAKRLLAGFVVLSALPAIAATGLLGDGAFERVLRVPIVFAILMAIFRLIGKRELSRLSPFELVTLMLIPEVLSNAIQAEGALLDALAGLSTLFFLVLVTSVFAHRFEGVEKVVEAGPTVLVADGRLLGNAMNEQRIVPDELLSEMRKQGIGDLSEVRWAVLEGSGNITFVPKDSRQMTVKHDEPEPA
jgi:uncharacterized membrane protein YcaP (DUF421 family)